MIHKKRLFIRIFDLLVFSLIMGLLASKLMDTTYAVKSLGSPDVIITINNKGQVFQKGNLFADVLWYPGDKGKEGTIRVSNNYQNIKLDSLSMAVKINKFMDRYMKDEVYKSFINNMLLSIETKNYLGQGAISILRDKPLAELTKGIVLDQDKHIMIPYGSTIDFKYTLRMDKFAGNELQNLNADVSLMIRVPLDNSPTEGDNPGGGDNSDEDETPTLVEEPIIKIPDLAGHWAHDCIITLIENEVLEVDENGSVRPDDNITRAEAAVLIGKALRLEPKDTLKLNYIDAIPKWAKGYVNITSEEKIFKGYINKQFKPNNNITREEMMAVLARAFKLVPNDVKLELPFSDKDEIGDWSLENVIAGYEYEVIVGYPDGTYKPQNNISRAESFVIICKLLKYHGEHLQKR